MPVTAVTAATGAHDPQDLVAEDLSYRYPGAMSDVLDGFSYRFRAGTLTAIVAPSGAGKSTLLSLLGLLLAPRAGTITLGREPVDWKHGAAVSDLRAARYNWILQNNACFERRTALDNVAMALLSSGAGMKTARGAARAALDSVGLASRAELPARLLSGGEQQRMTIARALLTQRPYLLADEPTGNLDRSNSQLVFGALRACADRGSTVIVVTHDLESAATADDVVDLARNAYSSAPRDVS